LLVVDRQVCSILTVDLPSRRAQADPMPNTSETTVMDHVRARLVQRYPHIDPDRIAVAVQQAHAHFERCRVRDYIGLLVERRAGAQLAAEPPQLKVTA
jgi:hypothetical protein